MQAHCPEQPAVGLVPSHEGEHKAAHFLYQTATVVAILLFLISFWSC